MSGSAPEEPQTSIPPSTPCVPDPAPVPGGPGSPSDVSFGEQNLSFTAKDIGLVEMMEIEYGQLQRILYSQMEAQDSEVEGRLSPLPLPGTFADSCLHQPSQNVGQEGCSSHGLGSQVVCPGLCQSALPSDSSLLSSNPHLGYADFQELRMMLLNEPNLPLSQTYSTSSSSSVGATGHSLVKVKHGENFVEMNKENVLVENSALAPEPRSKSTVRVRLEDRINSIQRESPRCQEPQESGATRNNLATLIRQPSELIGVPLHQQENKCPALGKNKTAPTTLSLPPTYPLFAMNTYSSAGSTNPSQAQTSGTSCTSLEAARHQDVGIAKTSFCYQGAESTKQTVEDTLSKRMINRRSCSQINPLGTNIDRRPLSDIQTMHEDSQSSSSVGHWQAVQSNSSVQIQSGTQEGITQRRERHNRMERDRRRKIRVCCDELNLLVPFCTVDTDKATTLRWTTAFLKYIQERHGDALKQEFETVFCSKTGGRLKIARSESFVTCPMQENTRGYGDQVV